MNLVTVVVFAVLVGGFYVAYKSISKDAPGAKDIDTSRNPENTNTDDHKLEEDERPHRD